MTASVKAAPVRRTPAKTATKPAMPTASRPRRTPVTPAAAEVTATPAVTPPVSRLIPLEQLHRHPDQPRQELTDLEGLAETIASVGLLQRPVVEEHGDGYAIVAGHRRVAALRLLGWTETWCDVRARDTNVITAMLVENDQRVGLTALEEAAGYQQLIDDGMSQREVAAKVGRNQSHISKRLSLLNLAAPLQAALGDGTISIPDALHFAKVTGEGEQARALERFTTTTYGYGTQGNAEAAVAAELREAECAEARAATRTELAAAGTRVVDDRPAHNTSEQLHRGTAERARHHEAGCLVAYIEHRGHPSFFCVKPKSHKGKEAINPHVDAERRDRRERKAAMAAREAACAQAFYVLHGNVDVEHCLATLGLASGVHSGAHPLAADWLGKLGLIPPEVMQAAEFQRGYLLTQAALADTDKLRTYYSAAALLGHWEAKARETHRTWCQTDADYLRVLHHLADYTPTAWERERLQRHSGVADVDGFLAATLHEALGTEPATTVAS